MQKRPPVDLSAAVEAELRELGLPAKRGRFSEYRHNPIGFMETVLGFHPWGPRESPTGHGGQQAIIRDLWEHKFVKVDSCNNAGKSYLAANIVPTFLHTIRNSMVVTVAPGKKQLEHHWRPMRSVLARAREKLPGRVLDERIEIAPKWYAQGIASDTEERYQGPHFEQNIDWGLDGEDGPSLPTIAADAEYGAILVLIDEHGGFEDRKAFFWNALVGYMAQPNVFILMIGNPNKAEGVPYQITRTRDWMMRAGEKWRVHKIGVKDVPPAIMEDGFEERTRLTYGEDHPQYKIRVLGEYAEGATDQMFPLWLLEKSAQIKGHPMPHDGKHMGVDVARQGTDTTVVVLMDRGRLAAVESWSIPDLTKQAEQIATLAAEWKVKAENIHIDIGMGAGLADRLAEAGLSVDLVSFGGEREEDWPELCPYDLPLKPGVARKTELHWALRQALEKGLVAIPDEAFTLLVRRQLGWILYDHDDQNRMFIEPKKKLKTRTGGESPDFADALVFAMARTGGMPSMTFL